MTGRKYIHILILFLGGGKRGDFNFLLRVFLYRLKFVMTKNVFLICIKNVNNVGNTYIQLKEGNTMRKKLK